MNSWIERNKQYTMISAEDNFSISFAGMKFDNEDLKKMQPLFEKAAKGIAAIEAGEIKNPDEGRKVTHFTDRIDYAKSALFAEVEAFVEKVRKGEITGETGKKFTAVAVNGIGGSALGPQLMQFAIASVTATSKSTSSTIPTLRNSPTCWKLWTPRPLCIWSFPNPAALRRPATT